MGNRMNFIDTTCPEQINDPENRKQLALVIDSVIMDLKRAKLTPECIDYFELNQCAVTGMFLIKLKLKDAIEIPVDQMEQ
jgi:hypothetical protein